MVIQWLGQSCFKIQSGELTLVIDPFGKEIGLTPPRFRADIVLVTHDHHDHSNSQSLTGDPFIISGPGEYEIKGVYIRGFETFHDKTSGKERGLNTVYKIEMEEITLLHLGDFGEGGGLREELIDQMGDVDILMLPAGGKYTIDGAEAARIVKQFEPRLAIPMHYQIPGLNLSLDGVEMFLKESGAGRKEPQEKLTVKKKEFGAEEYKTEIVALKPI